MKKLFKATVAVAVVSGVALLSGCTGQVYNQPKNCTYDYLFHPSVPSPRSSVAAARSINCLSSSNLGGTLIATLAA